MNDSKGWLLTRKEVEEHYGIKRRYLENAEMQGTGPRLIRLGRLVRYRIRDLEAWLDANASDGGG